MVQRVTENGDDEATTTEIFLRDDEYSTAYVYQVNGSVSVLDIADSKCVSFSRGSDVQLLVSVNYDDQTEEVFLSTANYPFASNLLEEKTVNFDRPEMAACSDNLEANLEWSSDGQSLSFLSPACDIY